MDRPKILIADDDGDHLAMLALLLGAEGYEILSARDAKQAIQLAVDRHPDIILLDINMGEQGGFDVQERLEQIKETAQTPVIYITGEESNWIRLITTGLGAHAVVRKPIDRKHLLGMLKSLTQAGQAEVVGVAGELAP